MVHVKQFFEMQGGEKGKVYSIFLLNHQNKVRTKNFIGLGYWSEQAFDAVHANFKLDWETGELDVGHEDYLKKLTDCISRYNARHI